MASNPKVSIIIPVYNGANYLRKAIESALNQTYKNIEIIVINDGSKDDGATEKIALSFGSSIHYFVKENGGVSSALNLGIEKASGEYISWLSHDDIYLSTKIEKQILFLEKLENKDSIISLDYELINEDGNIIGKIQSSYKPEELLYKLLIKSFLNGCTLLIPKKAFLEFGGFNINLKTTQDYNLWFQMIQKYRFIHINDFGVQSRQHSLQDSHTKLKIALNERKKLEDFVIKLFGYQKIKESYGKKIPFFLFFFHLRWKLLEPKIIGKLIGYSQKLGFYNKISPLWRKYIIK